MPEIRRCPFCGGRSIKIECFDNDAYMATCQDCGAGTGIKRTGTAARASWNMRASLKEESLQVVGEISITCPKCGVKLHGEVKPKIQAMKEVDDE
jgi:Lar family restriction alleviation protein